MDLRLIRNATVTLDHDGFKLLMDPYLAPKGSGDSYAGQSRSPLVDLPMPIPELLNDIDGVLLTHIHADHFDDTAIEAIDKETPIYCVPAHAAEVSGMGFENITIIEDQLKIGGLTITPTPAIHGPEEVWHYIGEVSGYMISGPSLPKVYFASDTVLCGPVKDTISKHQPDYIVTNSGGAFSQGKYGPIIMDAAQTVETLRLAPQATGIAIHMDTTDHSRETRQSFKTYLRQHGSDVAHRIHVPADGETITLK